eukprot:5016877-Alexandrium_andersonii.AAC.1
MPSTGRERHCHRPRARLQPESGNDKRCREIDTSVSCAVLLHLDTPQRKSQHSGGRTHRIYSIACPIIQNKYLSCNLRQQEYFGNDINQMALNLFVCA